MVKIVGINGSLRADSYSYQALNLAAQRVEALGAEVEILDLRQMQLPFCHGGEDYSDYPDVKRMQNTVASAHGLILATPEYHGGVISIPVAPE